MSDDAIDDNFVDTINDCQLYPSVMYSFRANVENVPSAAYGSGFARQCHSMALSLQACVQFGRSLQITTGAYPHSRLKPCYLTSVVELEIGVKCFCQQTKSET